MNLWFIPQAEPWRNGVVERFNAHYEQKLLDRVSLNNRAELFAQSLAFERRHNQRHRYSKLNGQTPNQSLFALKSDLRFPEETSAPRHPLAKPLKGQYYFVRFVRSDGLVHIFSETFHVPPACHYEYVICIVDVKEQKLKISHDQKIIIEYDYKM